MQYNTIQYNKYNTIQYNTIQYNTIQYNTVQYNAVSVSSEVTVVLPVRVKTNFIFCSSGRGRKSKSPVYRRESLQTTSCTYNLLNKSSILYDNRSLHVRKMRLFG